VNRARRTKDELRGASNHLAYEIQMLRVVANSLASGIAGESSPMANVLIESFTIHARNLLYFRYADKPWEDDVIAEDFFASADDWRDARPQEPSVLSNLRGRVGKEVAHLTYARLAVTAETKGWAFLDIAAAFQAATEKFGSSPKSVTGAGDSRSCGRCSRCRSTTCGSRRRDG
jgi:hypothetical protein